MKQMTGVVLSTKMDQTVVVQVTRLWKHPLYGKIVKRTKNFACHLPAEINVEEGQKVLVQEIRPMSKTKHFQVMEVMQ